MQTYFQITAKPLSDCFKTFEDKLKAMSKGEAGVAGVIAFRKVFDGVYEKIKEYAGAHPHTHASSRETYVEMLTQLNRILAAIERHRKAFTGSYGAWLHELEVACEWGFSQPHDPFHAFKKEHGDIVRNR